MTAGAVGSVSRSGNAVASVPTCSPRFPRAGAAAAALCRSGRVAVSWSRQLRWSLSLELTKWRRTFVKWLLFFFFDLIEKTKTSIFSSHVHSVFPDASVSVNFPGSTQRSSNLVRGGVWARVPGAAVRRVSLFGKVGCPVRVGHAGCPLNPRVPSPRRLSRPSPLWMRRARTGSRIRRLCRGNPQSAHVCRSYPPRGSSCAVPQPN